MNKQEFISALAAKSGLTKKDTETFLGAFTDVVGETLSNREKISLVGFGTFETRDRAARKGRNPQTSQEIDIPASVVPAFKAGNKLKDAVKG